MSIRSRLRSLEGQLPPEKPPEDPAFPYVVTAKHFDHICRELHCIFDPPPDVEGMLKQFTPEQVRNVWLSHYGCWENGKLVEPPIEEIEERDRLGAMTVQGWYESVLEDILRFPHRIEFDLEEFGLADWRGRVESCSHIDYDRGGKTLRISKTGFCKQAS